MSTGALPVSSSAIDVFPKETYGGQTIGRLKQLCRKRQISTKGFGDNKPKHINALLRFDYKEWDAQLSPLLRSLSIEAIRTIISDGHGVNPDIKPAIHEWEQRKVLVAQLQALEKSMEYQEMRSKELQMQMQRRGLEIPNDNDKRKMITRLRFDDLKRILPTYAFKAWPLIHLRPVASIIGIVADLDDHTKLCKAMERHEAAHVCPDNWRGLFQYPEKAPLSYLRGLLDKANVAVPKDAANNRIALLDLLAVYGAKNDPAMAEPLCYAEKLFGVSVSGDPWRKLHTAKTETRDRQPPSKKLRTDTGVE